MRYLNGHGKCDLMEFNGNSYVVLVDYYSDFFEVDRLNNKTADEVVRKIKAFAMAVQVSHEKSWALLVGIHNQMAKQKMQLNRPKY